VHDYEALRRRSHYDATFHWMVSHFVSWRSNDLASFTDIRDALAFSQVVYPGPDTMNDRMLKHFEFAHLPPHLQDVSVHFHDLAHHIVATVPQNAERTVALRKLLEAKDCAVRAVLEGAG
jgi:hypothetical protein